MNNSTQVLKSFLVARISTETNSGIANLNEAFYLDFIQLLITENSNNINLFLASNNLNFEIDQPFIEEFLFELAIFYFETKVNDEFIQKLINENHPDFCENLRFLKKSKNVIIDLERKELKNHFNKLDQLETEIQTAKIIEFENLNSQIAAKKESMNSDKKIFNLSSLLKYAAILILVPTTIILLYLNNKSTHTIVAKNQKTLQKKTVISDTTKTKNKLIPSSDSAKPKVEIPINEIYQYNITPTQIKYLEEYGFASKTINLIVNNLSNQLAYLQTCRKNKSFDDQQQKSIQFKIDSLNQLNNTYEFNEKELILKIYHIGKIKEGDIRYFKTNCIMPFNILEITGVTYYVKTTNQPEKLVKIETQEILNEIVE